MIIAGRGFKSISDGLRFLAKPAGFAMLLVNFSGICICD